MIGLLALLHDQSAFFHFDDFRGGCRLALFLGVRANRCDGLLSLSGHLYLVRGAYRLRVLCAVTYRHDLGLHRRRGYSGR